MNSLSFELEKQSKQQTKLFILILHNMIPTYTIIFGKLVGQFGFSFLKSLVLFSGIAVVNIPIVKTDGSSLTYLLLSSKKSRM